MYNSYQFRLYPTESQKELFTKTFGCVRYFYNRSLYESIEYYKQNKKSINITPATYKKEEQCSFLKEVDSLALANAQLQRQVAYKNFFEHRTKFPKYKKKTHQQSYTTNNQGNNIRIMERKTIKLPKVGCVSIKLHRSIIGVIKSCTVTKNCDEKYYISILTEQPDFEKLPVTNNTIGIDLGIKEFATFSNGEKVDNPKYYENMQDKLKSEQRKFSRMQKGSNNYHKQRIKVARVHSKIKNQRSDFLHKLSHKLINENQIICLETLDVKGMLCNGKLSKSISSASWSEFVRLLQYKGERFGRTIIKIPQDFASSQLCSKCGYKNKSVKDLSIREWVCPQCNTIHDRDINAAQNILKKGIEILSGREPSVELVDTDNGSYLEQEASASSL